LCSAHRFRGTVFTKDLERRPLRWLAVSTPNVSRAPRRSGLSATPQPSGGGHARAARLRLRTSAAVLALVLTGAAATVGGPAQAERSSGKQGVSGTTTPPAPFRVALQTVATLEQPIAIATRADDQTLYIVEKAGRVRAVAGGSVVPSPVLDIVARVDSVNERGLLGLAFAPNRRDVLYVDYTDRRGNVIVSEVPFDGTTADLSRERRLLDIAKPFNEHNAGTLHFDQQGRLYVAIGDGGGANDKFNNAQRLDSLLGKVLRIDPTATATAPYSIPADNPFATATLGTNLGTSTKRRPEILAFGLRNPWGISLDPATNALWVPDVGQNTSEEINRVVLGAGSPKPGAAWNFGWKLREGNVGTKVRGALDPVFAYPHKDGRCAIAGGRVYRGSAIPALVGWYLFADVCAGRLQALRPVGNRWEPVDLGARLSYVTSIGADAAGELLVTSLEGTVARVIPA
jgi:glucose/arabinose dehydrogenase